jgi:hypothetical protein
MTKFPLCPILTQSAILTFMDIRNAALLTCVTGVLSLLLPMWNNAQRMAELESAYPRWWIIIESVTVALFIAILPLFYFALYRNKGTLRFSRRLRLLALTAALALGINLAVRLPQWIGSLGQVEARSVLTPQREPWTVREVSGALNILSNAACVLMMVTVYRQTSDEPHSFVPVSKLLRVMTKTAVIAWGIWVAFNLVRVALIPYGYAVTRNYALGIGRTPPSFRDFVAEPALALLSQAGLFAGPYIIWCGSSQPKTGFPSIEPPPADLLSR